MGQSNGQEWWAELRLGHVYKIPTMQFSLEFPEIVRQNHIYAIIDWVCLRFPK